MTEQRRSTDQPESKKDSRRIRRIAIIAAVAVAVGFAAAGFAFYLNAGRTDDVAQLAQQIQDERAANTLRACRDVNQRHDDTIRALDELLKRAGRSASREQVERSRASTVLLIDALAPKRDCKRLVARQVGSSG